MEAIVVEGLSYQYDRKRGQILKDISFRINNGEMVALTGLSGCGKSTLCLCLNGIIPRLLGGEITGNILINGKSTRDHRVAEISREVGLVFQDPDTQLVCTTVEDEIAFALENMCINPKVIRERVEEILDLLRIADLKFRNPHQLSGGEKHLVILGAVLAPDPMVLVLDEVMSQLDDQSKERIWQVLCNLQKQGKTIFYVEHDREIIFRSHRVLVLEEGRLTKDGPTPCVL